MRCTYCGDPADTLDHFIPVSFNQTTRKGASFSKNHTVPCCRECNVLLGNKAYYTLGERAAYLEGRYKKRYDKLLSTPEWDAEELEELGYNLRESVLGSLKEKRLVQNRIDHLLYVTSINPTPEDVWEYQNDILWELRAV